MKDQILLIIENNPKRFSQIIKSNSELSQWVHSNSQVQSENFSEMIYSAIHLRQNICPLGQTQVFGSFNKGWGFCKNTCECSQKSRAQKVSESKHSLDEGQKQIINDKRIQTMTNRYGVAFNSQRPDIHEIWKRPKIDNHIHNLLMNSQWLDQEYNQKKRNLVDIAEELGVYYSTVGEYCKQHGFEIRQRTNYSQEEQAISKWLTEINIDHQMGVWDQIDGKELDIYISNRKLAIEVNGLYWHSWNPKNNKLENKHRHLEKSIACEQKGIQLIHITDREWHHQQVQIKNLLLSKLGLNRTIGARKCQLEIISNQEANNLLNQWHLQKSTPAFRSYALTHQGSPIMLITIGRSRFNKLYPYELLRLASSPGITVAGGLSRLIKFIHKDINYNSIISYCDRSKSQGTGYLASGFQLDSTTDPGYFWTNGTDQISRYQSQKKNLIKFLPNYDSNLSESQNMFQNQWRRYWDCGHWIFVYR